MQPRKLLLLTFLLLFPALEALAASPYEVSGVTVSQQDKDATAARTAAMAEGQHKAFASLIARLAPNLSADQTTISESDLTSMVQGISVQDEKISSTHYRATLTVSFNPEYVKAFLRDRSVGVIPVQTKPSLIIPLFEQNGKKVLWDKENPWWKAWEKAITETEYLKLVLPTGDQDDINVGTEEMIRHGSFDHLRALVERYHVDQIIVLDGKYENTGELRVSIRELKEGDTQTKLANFSGGSQKLDYVLETAAKDVIARLENEWKSANREQQASDALTLSVIVPFNGLKEWVTVKKRIADLSFLKDSTVTSLSSDQAVIEISYGGVLNDLLLDLQDAQFSLYQDGDRYILRSM